MTHPNRSKRAPSAPDITPAMLIAARHSAGHTQTQAAETVYRTLRGWQDNEAGKRPIDPAIYELYRLKTILN